VGDGDLDVIFMVMLVGPARTAVVASDHVIIAQLIEGFNCRWGQVFGQVVVGGVVVIVSDLGVFGGHGPGADERGHERLLRGVDGVYVHQILFVSYCNFFTFHYY